MKYKIHKYRKFNRPMWIESRSERIIKTSPALSRFLNKHISDFIDWTNENHIEVEISVG